MEVLIAPKNWRAMLRYATHERNDSWNPPLITLETATLRSLAWELSPLAYAAHMVIVAEYAAAPVLFSVGKARGSDGIPRRFGLRRALRVLQAASWGDEDELAVALDELVDKGLLVLITEHGEEVDGPVADSLQSRRKSPRRPA
jgi:hypothetical protein